MMLSNPADAVRWAVAQGRIPASDEALWLARLEGPGAEAYVELLVGDGDLDPLRGLMDPTA